MDIKWAAHSDLEDGHGYSEWLLAESPRFIKFHTSTSTCHGKPLTLPFTQEHGHELLILKQDGSLHQVLKVGVHTRPDACVLGYPFASKHIDVVSNLGERHMVHREGPRPKKYLPHPMTSDMQGRHLSASWRRLWERQQGWTMTNLSVHTYSGGASHKHI